MHKNPLSSSEKLAALRASDLHRFWQSLDDERQCILCERTFRGRQVRVLNDGHGKVRLHCPTEDCPATPREWVAPGDPLLDDEAWRDWLNILDDLPEESAPGRSASHSTTRFAD